MTSPLSGVRLVVLDLDGTLLPASKVLTDRAIGVVRDVRAAGIDVTLATGKAWNHTRRYGEELGLTAPLVALEGGLVARADAGQAHLHRRTLPVGTVTAIQNATKGLDVGSFYCHDQGRTRAQRRLESWLPQLRIWDPHVEFTDEAPLAGDSEPHDAFGFHLIGLPAAVADARARVAGLALPGIDVYHAGFWDGHDQLHVRPTGVDKRTGLVHVLDDLGIAASEMLAAGDWLNDLGMFGLAGVSVAPANAVDQVKAVADHVLPGTCEEDAVVEFLAGALRGL